MNRPDSVSASLPLSDPAQFTTSPRGTGFIPVPFFIGSFQFGYSIVSALIRRSLHSRWTKLFLGVLVTIACLWWAFQQMLVGENGPKSPSQVFQEIASAFRKADYRTLPVMWFCLAVFYWLKAVRWKYLLSPLGQFRPIRELMPSTVIGFAFNNVLPAHLGEFVRVFVFSRKTKLPRTAVLSSIVLERMFDVVAILFFLVLGIWLADFQDVDPKIESAMVLFTVAVCIGLVGAVFFVIKTDFVVGGVDRILSWLPFIPSPLTEKVTQLLHVGADGLASLRSVSMLVGIVTTSFLQWLLNAALIHLSLMAFGIPTSPALSAIVMGVTAFGVTVPSSPGYFGVIQLCFLLVLFDQDRETVFAASIYYHMMQWIPVTAIGMILFVRSGFTVAEVEHLQEEELQEAESIDGPTMN